MSKIGKFFGRFAAAAHRLPLLFLLLAGACQFAAAAEEASCSSDLEGAGQDPSPAIEQLLSNIKAEFAGSHILRLEQRARDLEGSQLIYAVKLLPPDGRVAWLMFDACTLQPLFDPRGPGRSRAPR
jgi:hypothetical protein